MECLLRLDGLHLHRRLLAALVILLGGIHEFWRTGRVTGLELLLGPDSGRYLIERKISVCTAPVAHTTTCAISD